MNILDFLKPKTEIINQDNQQYQFTPGNGPKSGLLVRPPYVKPGLNIDLEKKAKVIMADPRLDEQSKLVFIKQLLNQQ